MRNVNVHCRIKEAFWYPYGAKYIGDGVFAFEGNRIDSNGIMVVDAESETSIEGKTNNYILSIRFVRKGKLIIANDTIPFPFNFVGRNRIDMEPFERSVKAQALKLYYQVAEGK